MNHGRFSEIWTGFCFAWFDYFLWWFIFVCSSELLHTVHVLFVMYFCGLVQEVLSQILWDCFTGTRAIVWGTWVRLFVTKSYQIEPWAYIAGCTVYWNLDHLPTWIECTSSNANYITFMTYVEDRLINRYNCIIITKHSYWRLCTTLCLFQLLIPLSTQIRHWRRQVYLMWCLRRIHISTHLTLT